MKSFLVMESGSRSPLSRLKACWRGLHSPVRGIGFTDEKAANGGLFYRLCIEESAHSVFEAEASPPMLTHFSPSKRAIWACRQAILSSGVMLILSPGKKRGI